MRATVINCTLKPSPEPSNTEALAEVVTAGLRERRVKVDTVRAVDHDLRPGAGPDYLDDERGHDWAAKAGRAMAANLAAVAAALAARPIPPPPQ